MPAVVDREKCEGCKDCEEACPNESIKVAEDNIAVVNEDDCIDCQACVSACMPQAVTIP